MNSPETTTTTPQDLTNDSPLARRIDGTAGKLAYEYGADYDDVRSEIVLAILEVYTDDPRFLEENTVAYIVSRGAWRARDALKRECVQFINRTVDGDAPVGDDGDALLETIPDGNAWSETEFGLAVRDALSGLGNEDRRIARMYAGGWGAGEIADEVGIARRTVYYRLNHSIRDALAERVFA